MRPIDSSLRVLEIDSADFLLCTSGGFVCQNLSVFESVKRWVWLLFGSLAYLFRAARDYLSADTSFKVCVDDRGESNFGPRDWKTCVLPLKRLDYAVITVPMKWYMSRIGEKACLHLYPCVRIPY